jgi:hypothetical protein
LILYLKMNKVIIIDRRKEKICATLSKNNGA